MRKLLLSLSLSVLCYSTVDVVRAENAPSHQWQRPDVAAVANLDVSGSHGSKHFSFALGQSITIDASMLQGDGTYRWDLTYSPQVSATLLAQAEQRRLAGDNSPLPGWPQALPAERGMLQVADGQFVALDLEEPEPTPGPGGVVPNDQVIADDLIVQSSICAGFDCVNNESFGFDTFRLKENNTRIGFDDTSVGAFAANDWTIVANDSASGGANYLAFEDVTGARMPFRVDAGAPTDSLRVASTGRMGIGTGSPVLDVHIANSNTPGVRLEQNNSGGFTAQTWDVAGNEANFFVRDVTGGSRLPFRIRPGAPTSSIDIAASGNVGVGTASPAAALQIIRTSAFTDNLLLIGAPDDGNPLTEERRLALDNSGNLFVGGTITQLSSKYSKENLIAVAGSTVLDRLRKLNLWTWNYRTSTSADRHLGPVAEDFYASFGLGVSDRSVAPADMAGVALAASQALTAEIDQRDQQISTLEARIAKLEAALEKLSDNKN